MAFCFIHAKSEVITRTHKALCSLASVICLTLLLPLSLPFPRLLKHQSHCCFANSKNLPLHLLSPQTRIFTDRMPTGFISFSSLLKRHYQKRLPWSPPNTFIFVLQPLSKYAILTYLCVYSDSLHCKISSKGAETCSVLITADSSTLRTMPV